MQPTFLLRCRPSQFIKNQNDVEAVVILAGTNNLSKKNCTPEDLLEIVLKSVKDLTENFSGKVFICKVPPRIDLYNVDSKINRFNDLLSISELSNHKSVILVETIGREVRYFNIFNGHCDGLWFNGHCDGPLSGSGVSQTRSVLTFIDDVKKLDLCS